jgi:hypothetical protein
MTNTNRAHIKKTVSPNKNSSETLLQYDINRQKQGKDQERKQYYRKLPAH